MTPIRSSYSITVLRAFNACGPNSPCHENGPGGPHDTPYDSRMTPRMTVRDVIAEKLTRAFAPERLDVTDESHRHAGHAGARPGGETHYTVYIVSHAFRGKSRIDRHRMVNATLVSELQGGVHALAIRAMAPGEAGGDTG
jgi:BolA family transcriptional regulator, general stress-responsive regulator